MVTFITQALPPMLCIKAHLKDRSDLYFEVVIHYPIVNSLSQNVHFVGVHGLLRHYHIGLL